MSNYNSEHNEIDPSIILWSTRDAAFLPFYLIGFFLSISMLANQVLNSSVWGAFIFPLILFIYTGWKSLRALEAHFNLKRLQKLYEELRNGA